MSEFIHLGINASLLNENEQLKDKNVKQRELICEMLDVLDTWQYAIANGDATWGYGKGCLEQLNKFCRKAQELGIEIKI